MLGVSVQVDTSPIPASMSDLQTRSITLKAVRAGIKIVQSRVKAEAPRKRRHLQRAQGTVAKKGRKGKTIALAVQGAKTKYIRTRPSGGRAKSGKAKVWPAKYDHLVIGGTKPHGVRKGGGTLAKKHPGGRANPYRRRAYDSVSGQVNAEMLRVTGIEVQKMLAKNEAKILKKLSGR